MIRWLPFLVIQRSATRGTRKTLYYGMRTSAGISYSQARDSNVMTNERGRQEDTSPALSDRHAVSAEAGVVWHTFWRKCVMKTSKILHWYHVLRINYHFTAFQAIRFALWLAQ
jgi:hypothetical protein